MLHCLRGKDAPALVSVCTHNCYGSVFVLVTMHTSMPQININSLNLTRARSNRMLGVDQVKKTEDACS